MEITVTQETREQIEALQKEFARELSDRAILKGTAQAINSALSKAISNKQHGLRAAIKREYNVSNKSLSKNIAVKPKATSSNLYGGICVNTGKIPLIDFKPKQTGSNITVAIHKGQVKVIRNSFIAKMNSGHIGVFARGRYKGSEFVPGRFKPGRETTKGYLITELKSTSPFGMVINEAVMAEAAEFAGHEMVVRPRGILQSKIDKIKK